MDKDISRRELLSGLSSLFAFGMATTLPLLPQSVSPKPQSKPAGKKKSPTDKREDEVAKKVKRIVVEQLGVDEDKVTLSARFVEDLGADSLDVVELVMAFEEAFDIEIPDEDAEKLKTVANAIDYIKTHAKPRKR